VRLQYDDEDEGFFSAIRKTFTGDGDDNDYGTRRSDYRDDYSRDQRGSNRDRGVSYRMPRNPEPDRGRGSYADGYDDWEETRPKRDRRPEWDEPRTDARNYRGSNGSDDYDYRATAPSPSSTNSGPRRRPAAPSKSNGSRYEERPPARGDRNQPINNGWDQDDDDDWF